MSLYTVNTHSSKLKLYCGASLRVNITQGKEKEKKKKWISPFPFVYVGSLFSSFTDLGWGLERSIFLSFKENCSSRNCFFLKKVACTETLI